MEKVEHDVQWLRRGRQRAAIARVLRKPMTATEMRAAARPLNPRIQLRDIWFLMRQFQERNLARCINPRQTSGRLYCLTDYGRQVVEDGFGITVGISGKGINWKKYSWVVRANDIFRVDAAATSAIALSADPPRLWVNPMRNLAGFYFRSVPSIKTFKYGLYE